jgi:hypothetical protein
VDHRVEPPAWLPKGAAPETTDAEAAGAEAAEDAPTAEDDDTAAPGNAPEEFSNGNGRDGTHAYDGPHRFGDDEPAAEGTVYRSPFDTAGRSAEHYEPDAGAGAQDGEPAGVTPDGDVAGNDHADTTPAGTAPPGGGLAGPGPDRDAVTAPYAGTQYAAAPYAPPDYAPPPAAAYPAADTLGGADTTMAGAGAFGGAASVAGAGAAYSSAGATVGGATQRRATARFSRELRSQARPATAQPRRANLVVARIEPWSVMKFSFLISLVAWIVLFVAVALLYYALSSLGVFAALQRTLSSVTSGQGSAGVDLSKWTSATRVLGYTMLLGAVDVVLITALSTVGAVIYNLVTHIGGGIEVTLKETE